MAHHYSAEEIAELAYDNGIDIGDVERFLADGWDPDTEVLAMGRVNLDRVGCDVPICELEHVHER